MKKGISTTINSIISILLFVLLIFILPLFSFFNKIPLFIIYIYLIIVTVSLNYKLLIKDFLAFKSDFNNKFKYILKCYIYTILVMALVSILVITFKNGEISKNQELVNSMLKKFPVATLLLSTIYAPIVEEIVFRLSFNTIIKNKYVYLFITSILFGCAHMIGKFNSISDIVYVIQYSALGFCLAKTYYDSKNIYTSMGVHFIQNLLSAIFVILTFI